MQKRLSIKAIAKDLSISPTTISFILNDKAVDNRISQALIDRVKSHLEKIGYQPSQLAQSLRTGKSKIIVFMVEDISNPFFAAIAKTIELLAFKDGYTVIYCSTDNDPEKTLCLIRKFNHLRVEGYIITPPLNINPSEINQLIKNGNTVVLFDRQLPEVECRQVIKNNYEAIQLGQQLTEALFSHLTQPHREEIHLRELHANSPVTIPDVFHNSI